MQYNPLCIDDNVRLRENVYQSVHGDETVYVKYTRPVNLDGKPEIQLYANMTASTVLNDVDVAPYMEYHGDEGMIVTEDAGERVGHFYNEEIDAIDIPSFVESLVAKAIVGDTDMHTANITVDEDGVCHPIDFDLAGTERVESYDDLYNRLIGTASRKHEPLAWYVNEENIENALGKVQDQIDQDAVIPPIDRTLAQDLSEDITDRLETIRHNVVWLDSVQLDEEERGKEVSGTPYNADKLFEQILIRRECCRQYSIA